MIIYNGNDIKSNLDVITLCYRKTGNMYITDTGNVSRYLVSVIYKKQRPQILYLSDILEHNPFPQDPAFISINHIYRETVKKIGSRLWYPNTRRRWKPVISR